MAEINGSGKCAAIDTEMYSFSGTRDSKPLYQNRLFHTDILHVNIRILVQPQPYLQECLGS